MLDGCLSLVFEAGSFGSLQRGGRFGRDAGTVELCNSVDENLSRRCTKSEWVTIPKDDV